MYSMLIHNNLLMSICVLELVHKTGDSQLTYSKTVNRQKYISGGEKDYDIHVSRECTVIVIMFSHDLTK